MIANELPELDKEDAKYSSFQFMLEKEPKNYNLVLKFPEKQISKEDLFNYLNSGLKF
jgi:hypothetical protein